MKNLGRMLAMILAMLLVFSSFVLTATAEDETPAALTVDADFADAPEGYSGQGVENLFDGSVATKYCVDGSAATIIVPLTEEAVVKGYSVSSADDVPARDPKAWTLYGSDDGETWNMLDQRADQSFADRLTTNDYAVENSTPYLWYKFDVTENSGAGILQFSELTFLPYKPAVSETPAAVKLSVDTSTVTGTPGNGTSEGLLQAVDGDKSTKYLTNTVPAEIIFSLTESAVVNYYDLTSADHGEWDPKAWTLYGSADGETWTAIDSRTNEDFLLTPDTNRYEIENDTAYLWYKLKVTESHGEAFGYYIAVSEIELFCGTPAEEEIEGIVIDYETVSGSEGNGTSQSVLQALDGNPDTKFLTASVPAVIVFALKKSAVVNSYSLTCADHGEWDPKAWTLYGSEDGVNWTALDSEEEQNFIGRGETNEYFFENEDEYLWYKLEVTESHGSVYGFNVAVSELVLANGAPEEEGFFVVLETVTGTPGNGTGEGLPQAFDGNSSSKYLTATLPAEVIFSLNKAVAINYYELTSTDHGEWDPKAWKFYGSDDGTEWTEIDSRTAQDFEGRGTTNSYFFGNTTEYLWYKLEVTETHGEAFGFKAAIAELTVDKVVVNTDTVSGTAGDGDHTIYSLLDGKADTKYLVFRSSDEQAVEVQFQLSRPVVVNTYVLTTANDWDVRDPKAWTLYGSTDGVTWTQLDSRADEIMTRREYGYVFQFENENAYDWYKISFTANNGLDPWNNNIIQVSELALMNLEGEIVDDSISVDSETITSSTPNGSNIALKLFDGDASSKFLTSETNAFVQFALKSPKAINAYTMTSAGDWAARHPSAWILYGSTDGETWVKLDERTGESPEGFQIDHRFVFVNTTEYLWYKLVMTARNCSTKDSVSPPLTGFGELTLEVTEDPAVLTHQLTIDTSSVVAPNGTSGNGFANLFDNDAETRYLVQQSAIDVEFKLTKAAPVNRYVLGWSKDHLERSPKTFAFYGSEDGENWVLLDSRDLEAKSSDDNRIFCGEAFAFENNVAYAYYRLSVTAVSSGSYVAMSKLNVFTASPAEGLDVYAPATVSDLTGIFEATAVKTLTVKAPVVDSDSVDAIAAAAPITVYGHKAVGGGGLDEALADVEGVEFVNLLEIVKTAQEVKSDKNCFTAIGAVKADDLEYETLTMTIVFKQNGEAVRVKNVRIWSLYTTVNGYASVSEATATAQGYEYFDASYLTAVSVKGIPAGSYDVEVQFVGTVRTSAETTAEICSEVFTAEISF